MFGRNWLIAFVVGCVVLAAGAVGIAGGPKYPVKNFVACPRVEVPPVMDGKLDDPCWAEAAEFTGFSSRDFPKAQTTCWLAHDKDNLYLAFKCNEPCLDEIKAGEKQHDGPVWRDDCVEVFLNAGQGRKTYFHIAVNSIGTTYDAMCALEDGLRRVDDKWDAGGKVNTFMDKDGWGGKLAIPFKSIGKIPADGETWGFNVCRERKQGKMKINEESCWAQVAGGFHEPENFGTMAFGGYAPAIRKVEIKMPQHVFKARVANKVEKNMEMEFKTVVISALPGAAAETSKKISLNAGHEEELEFEYQPRKGEKQQLVFSVYDSRTHALCYQACYCLVKFGNLAVPLQVLAKTADYVLWLEGSTKKVFREDLLQGGGSAKRRYSDMRGKGGIRAFSNSAYAKRRQVAGKHTVGVL